MITGSLSYITESKSKKSSTFGNKLYRVATFPLVVAGGIGGTAGGAAIGAIGGGLIGGIAGGAAGSSAVKNFLYDDIDSRKKGNLVFETKPFKKSLKKALN